MGKSAGKGLIWRTYVVIIGTNKRKYLISQSELDSLHFDLFSFLYTNAAPALTRSGVCIYLQSLAEFAATGGKKQKSFSAGACTWRKIQLRLQVWNLSRRGQILRAQTASLSKKSPGLF